MLIKKTLRPLSEDSGLMSEKKVVTPQHNKTLDRSAKLLVFSGFPALNYLFNLKSSQRQMTDYSGVKKECQTC